MLTFQFDLSVRRSEYMSIFKDHHSAAVRVCLEANVTEILREAGPDVSIGLLLCFWVEVVASHTFYVELTDIP